MERTSHRTLVRSPGGACISLEIPSVTTVPIESKSKHVFGKRPNGFENQKKGP
jgi:hypothetical protein